MKLFLDSANIDEIKELNKYGLIYGVTTTVKSIKRYVQKEEEDINLKKYMKSMLKINRKIPFFFDINDINKETFLKNGKNLYEELRKHYMFIRISNLYMNVPIDFSFSYVPDFNGLRMIRNFKENKIPVNASLITKPEQALLAAEAGAKFVTINIGDVDDFIRKSSKVKFKENDYFPAQGLKKRGKVIEDEGIVSGIDLVYECVALFKERKNGCKIIVSDIRNSKQLREAMFTGADYVSAPYSLIKEGLHHDQTVKSLISYTRNVFEDYLNLNK